MDWLYGFLERMDQYFQALADLPKGTKDVIAVSTIVVGALFCFLGYRFFKYLLGLAGFLSLGILSMIFYYDIPWVNTWGEIGQYIVAAVFGAVGAIAFYFLFYYFGVFVFGSVAAMWTAMLLLPAIEYEYRILLILFLGFVGGLLSFFLRRQITIFFTAAVGSICVMLGIGYFYNWPLSITNLSLSRALNGSLFDSLINHSDGMLSIALLAMFWIAGIAFQNFIKRVDVNPRRR